MCSASGCTFRNYIRSLSRWRGDWSRWRASATRDWASRATFEKRSAKQRARAGRNPAADFELRKPIAGRTVVLRSAATKDLNQQALTPIITRKATYPNGLDRTVLDGILRCAQDDGAGGDGDLHETGGDARSQTLKVELRRQY